MASTSSVPKKFRKVISTSSIPSSHSDIAKMRKMMTEDVDDFLDIQEATSSQQKEIVSNNTNNYIISTDEETIKKLLLDTKRPSVDQILFEIENISTKPIVLKTPPQVFGDDKASLINYREILFRKYLAYNNVFSSILNSYNYFMEITLPMILKSKEIIIENNKYQFDNIVITPPSKIDRQNTRLYPDECRKNMSNYLCDVTADLYQIIGNESKKVKEKVPICKLPVMLRSKVCNLYNLTDDQLSDPSVNECRYDPFGYFIIRGVEKTVFNTESLRVNRIFKYPIKGKSKSKPLEENVSITCPNPKGCTVVQLIFKEDDNIVIKTTDTINDKQKDINVFMIFLLFIEDIKNYLVKIKVIDESLDKEETIVSEFLNIFTKPNYTAKCKKIYITSLNKALYSYYEKDDNGESKFLKIISEAIKFPPSEENRIKEKIIKSILPFNTLNDKKENNVMSNIISKLSTLSIMVMRICEGAIGVRKNDNRDSWGSKKIETVGKIFEKLFTKALDYSVKVVMDGNSINNFDISKIITDTFVDSFTSNNFGIKTDYYRYRASEQLVRNNNASIISFITKVIPPANERSKVQEIRKIQLSQCGFICPVTTPDSSQCGMTKELSTTCKITNMIDPDNIKIKYSEFPTNINILRLFINGVFHGWTTYSEGENLKMLRRYDKIDEDTCIYMDDTEIWIDTLSSRLVRPLIVAEKIDELRKMNINNINFKELRRKGIIEYIDSWEQEKLLIAESLEKYMESSFEKKKEYTHIEIDPNALLGFTASCIPFPGHMQGPRSTYQANMSKQAMTIYHSLYNKTRYDTSIKVLHSSQVPLIYTNVYDFLHKQNPGGFNCIIAIMPFMGYNQEDAIIFNKSSIQMGMFHYSVIHTYRSICDSGDVFEKPPKFTDEYIDEKGLPKVGYYLGPLSCIIGKIHKTVEMVNGIPTEIKEDASEYLDKYTSGYVESVVKTINSDGREIVKVRLRQSRVYVEGDKMASRYAQKGTIGLLVDRADMPFTEDGVVPDVIVNPHSIPSRMTMGMLMEILSGKASVLSGERVNATSFRPFDTRKFEDVLKQYGFSKSSKEILTDGKTGKTFNTQIFTGICYYQALKHHPADKIQVRSYGAVSSWTRQAVAGRGIEGGLRIGEMERDSMLAHGASYLLHDRLCTSSDEYKMNVCNECLTLSEIVVDSDGNMMCKKCILSGNKCEKNIKSVTTSYSTRLFITYLAGLGIKVQFISKEVEKEYEPEIDDEGIYRGDEPRDSDEEEEEEEEDVDEDIGEEEDVDEDIGET